MDKMDNPPTDIVLKASLSDAYGLPPPMQNAEITATC